MVTTRTIGLSCEVGSNFYSANGLSRCCVLERAFVCLEHPRQTRKHDGHLACVLLFQRWNADRYVRCLYTMKEDA